MASSPQEKRQSRLVFSAPAPPSAATGRSSTSSPGAGNNYKLPSIQPVDYSLTAGTDIPPPESSPATPQSPGQLHDGRSSNEANLTAKSGSSRPLTSLSAAPSSSSPTSSSSPSVRKLLSLGSLNGAYTNPKDEAGAGKNTSATTSTPSPQPGRNNLAMKAPSVASSSNGSSTLLQPPSTISKRKSGNWFRRKSASWGHILSSSSDHHESKNQPTSSPASKNTPTTPDSPTSYSVPRKPLGEAARNVQSTHAAQRRPATPPPTLPSLDATLDGGSLSADDLFKDIK
ncbi:hypothetical protein L228DRAFT_238615 [Xylona heveae TC161]|uniref:Uncharacterized protein n=1 Tax=Xylona heveae (strain CBS 132557 / TC161) TaxID=1328760 RepID=A0A165GWS3_XYLHT|nr:hypothetical protein L228DRAFT_238615 [Xylona heveae TC161]KZF22698.1 hypothetical protein L228DRAFT_238615 [Xylona heveae TC161]